MKEQDFEPKSTKEGRFCWHLAVAQDGEAPDEAYRLNSEVPALCLGSASTQVRPAPALDRSTGQHSAGQIDRSTSSDCGDHNLRNFGAYNIPLERSRCLISSVTNYESIQGQ